MTRQEKSTLPRVAAKAKASFINYVDMFLVFFNHLPTKVIYTKYSKHSNETNTFMGLGRAGRFGQS